ncbi:hypothetical protein GCM10022397_37910 [Flavivirga jejuensis]
MAFQYAIKPELKPNNSVANAVPIAILGSSPKPIINKGEKNTAPPIPDDMAIVAIAIDIGNKYQNSIVNSIIFMFNYLKN